MTGSCHKILSCVRMEWAGHVTYTFTPGVNVKLQSRRLIKWDTYRACR